MNKTELKVFLKGLANFYVVLMIIAFLPTPGKDCSPGRLVRCIAIYTIVSIVIFSAVYFWNRIRKGPDKRPDTCPVPDAKETKDDDLSISRFLTLRNMGACFIYFLCVFALLYPEMSLESMLKASARSTGYCILVLLVAGIVYCVYQSHVGKKKSIWEKLLQHREAIAPPVFSDTPESAATAARKSPGERILPA